MCTNNWFCSFFLWWGLLTSLPLLSFAQIDSNRAVYTSINENLFVNTKWKYTYTTHAESNTVIHKADEDYQYFIFFKYDYSYQMFLNGKLSHGAWELNKAQNEVAYDFRNIKWWRIASFSEEALTLEFSLHPKASYRYHFIRVATEDAPFVRSPNDLPDVDVGYAPIDTKESSNYMGYLARRGIKYNKNKWERRKLRRKKRDERRQKRLAKTARGRQKLKDEEPRELIQIELVGGGYWGGVDPVYRNITVIKTDGRVIREFQTELQGLRVSKHNIERDSLEVLIKYITDKKFFDFDKVYTCESPACMRRINTKPRPIALRLAITKGVHRKIITIAIWDGQGIQNSLINYPPELDAIVRAIETFAMPPY